MAETKPRPRAANFCNEELLFLAQTYDENRSVLQSRDKKSESSQRKRKVYENMTNSMNARNPLVKRKPKQIVDKLKHMFMETRKLPHCKKTTPTGGGPPLPPLTAWQEIIVNILRDNPATEGLQTGIESGVDQHTSNETITFTGTDDDAENFDVDVDVELPLTVQATAQKKNGKVKSLTDHQIDLIQLEKEKIIMEKELLSWKIKLAKHKYAKICDTETYLGQSHSRVNNVTESYLELLNNEN